MKKTSLFGVVDFLIDSSLLVGVAVFFLVLISEIQLKVSAKYHLKLFLLASSVFGYNYLKSSSLNFYKKYWLLNIGCLCVILFSVFHLNRIFLSALFFCMPLLFFYKHPLPFIKKPFREYGVLKIVVVAFCWSVLTIFITNKFNERIVLIFLQRFLFILAVMIPFEIFGTHKDHLYTKTLPQRVGLRCSKTIGYILVVIFFVLGEMDVPHVLFSLLIFFSVFKSHPNSKYYTYLFVELLPVFWYLFLIGIK